jgi:hypothetical protein
MKMNNQVPHYVLNTQTVLASDVIARAVITAGGTRHIVSVYAESTNIQFFWVNEEGKKAGVFKKDSGPYQDFNSFVQYFAQMKKGTIESSQIYSAVVLSAITLKPHHFSVTADWTPRIASTDIRDYERQHQRLASKSRHTVAAFWPTTRK